MPWALKLQQCLVVVGLRTLNHERACYGVQLMVGHAQGGQFQLADIESLQT